LSSFRIPPFTTDDPYAVRPLHPDDSRMLTTRTQVPLAASAFGLELVADVLIMLGTIFYLRKSRREPSLGFRYVHICILACVCTTEVSIKVKWGDCQADHLCGKDWCATDWYPGALLPERSVAGIPIKFVVCLLRLTSR
jgi:hypothetical protein